MDDDPADAACFVETHVLPGLSRIGRLVDAVAHHVAVANGPSLAGSGPDLVVVGTRYRKRADSLDGLAVEDWGEGVAAISRFPDAAGRGSDVVGGRVAWNTGGGGDAVADRRSHETELKVLRDRRCAAAPALGERGEAGDQNRG